METIIIGRGYNIEEDSSVGKELIKQFESKIYDKFTCLVTFASKDGYKNAACVGAVNEN